MSARDPGGTPPATAAGPVASLSAGALTANLPRALAAATLPDDVPPLAFDAWGHGAAWVRATLSDAVASAAAPSPSAAVLYGLDPVDGDARPVMRLSGRVLSTKELRAGEGVSYGYAYRAAEDTRIALVTGGYAQGIVRALGNRADVVMRGDRHRIVGRVAMDVCVVEIGGAEVARGDEVVFFGDPARGEPALTEWAALLGWSPAELVTAVGRRALRRVCP